MMEASVVIREYAPVRALRLFTSVPDSHQIVRVRPSDASGIYREGMYVIVDPAQKGLVEGVDAVIISTGGPSDAFRDIAIVKRLCRAFGGWCLVPGGSTKAGDTQSGATLRLVDGPFVPEGLQRRIIGHVVGYLGDRLGEPIRDLWPAPDGLPLRKDAFTLADLPQTYVCQCAGVCLEPLFPNGSKLTFDASSSIEPGDIVSLWLKPEFAFEAIEFQCMVKRLLPPLPAVQFPLPDYMPVPPVALVEMDNPAKVFAVPLDRVMAVHKCLGIYGGPRWKPSREEMQSIVANERKAAAGGGHADRK